MRGHDEATLAQRWSTAVAVRSDSPFLVWDDGTGRPHTWTYGEFDDLIDRVAGALHERGVRRGRSVHLALSSCPAFVAAWLAVARLGAWMVPADPKATAQELTSQFARTGPVVGVCGVDRADVYAAAVGAAAERGPQMIAVAETGSDLGELIGSACPALEAPQPSDRLAVMFTSGTTSAPKGVELTQANYAFAGDVMAAAAGLAAHDRQLVVLPLFHANAQYYSFAAAISVGASVALVNSFSASQFRRQAAELGATHASLFAAPIRMILARDDGQPIPSLGLRHVWFAQNLTADQYEQFASLVGCRPRQLYGMTETLPAVITQRPLDGTHDVMGEVTLGCSVDVIDVDGHSCPPGDVGDLVVGGFPGATIFAGYLDDPSTTEASVVSRRDDGFVVFRTGDRALVDERGWFRFAGRSGDVLKVAGENVSVVEVEAVLAEHPDIFEVAVVGMPDPIRDEVPAAYAVAKPGRHIDPDQVIAWSAERLAPAKRPRAVVVVDELPRTSVGKIRKFMLTGNAATNEAS